MAQKLTELTRCCCNGFQQVMNASVGFPGKPPSSQTRRAIAGGVVWIFGLERPSPSRFVESPGSIVADD